MNDVRYEIFKSHFDLRPARKSLVVATQESGVDFSLIPEYILHVDHLCASTVNA